MALAALDRVSLAFGDLPLLDQVTLRIEPGERVSVIGRNGTGKSTLLRILSGEQAPDTVFIPGKYARPTGLRRTAA